MKKKAAVAQSGINTDPSKEVREASPVCRVDVGSNPTSGTKLKRVTKRELDHRLTLALAELAETQAELKRSMERDYQLERKLQRFERVASVRVDQLTDPVRPITVSAFIDQSTYHRYGKQVLLDAVCHLFEEVAQDQMATQIPKLESALRENDMIYFLSEWLKVVCHRNPLVLTLQEEGTAKRIVTRLIQVITTIQEAGRDNYKVREGIMWGAFNNPITK